MDYSFIIGLIVGLFIGIPIALVLLGMCFASSRADEQSERIMARRR